MRTVAFSAVAVVIALAGSVQAGGPASATPDPLPAADAAPAAALDWSGVYGGLTYGRTSGDFYSDVPAPFTYDYENGSATGGFLGYNVQHGTLVYGAELGYSNVSGMVLGAAGLGGNDTLDSLLDLRARLGYATGKALVYGAVGYSRAGSTVNGTDSVDLSGASLAVGVDYRVSQNMFLGLDLTRRNLSGTDENPINTFDIDSKVSTITLRLGLNF